MNTLKSVGNKLFKTELGNQKIELGLVQDLEKLLSNIKSLSNPISQNIDKLTNLNKMIKDEKESSKNNLTKLNQSYQKAVTLVERLDKQAKDLGIDAPIVKIAFNELKGAEEDYNDLSKLIKQI